jgi:hypothetical protein
LARGTQVLIELLDINGNPIYIDPVKNYQEGLARAITVEIYPDTPYGIGTLTVLGQLVQDINGNLPPPQFSKSYNVKFQKQILIAPNIHNDSIIRTYALPTASVIERLNPYEQSQQAVQYISGGVITGVSTNLANSTIKNYYAIQMSNPSYSFTKEVEGGIFMSMISGSPFTSSIVSVLNTTTAFLNIGYTGSTAMYQQFQVTNYTIAYTGSASLSLTQFSRSYADITLSNLDTFSGNINQLKIYVQSVDVPNTFEALDTLNIVPLELLMTQSYKQDLIKYGFVKSQSMVDTYWKWGFLNDSASFYA